MKRGCRLGSLLLIVVIAAGCASTEVTGQQAYATGPIP